MSTFKELNLPGAIEGALKSLKYEVPTPIQAQAIPVAIKGHDLIGSAQTGTGKTAAFCIPVLMKLMEQPQAVALVLVPTRELAQQIELFWKNLTQNSAQFRTVALIGGASMQPQVRWLAKRPRFIIATPGRLIDHLNRKTLSLHQTAILVLDEADRMLDMGFAPQLNEVVRYLPNKRQTLLFSATWSPEMDRLSKKYLRDPVRVSVDTVSQAAKTIQQKALPTISPRKNEDLLDQINQREGSVLVFARTKSRTDRVAKYLASYGLKVNRLHGGRTQGQRNAALNSFRVGTSRILVATDIAARGIDVSHIAHVINYDLPQVPEDYVHRVGRTGRAGSKGEALSFITPEERGQWRDILKLLKKSGSPMPEMIGDKI